MSTAAIRRVALSIRQPWATLIVYGIKRVELRSWSTRFSGPGYIHAGRSIDANAPGWKYLPDDLKPLTTLVGGIIGRAEFTGCRRYSSEEEYAKDIHLHCHPSGYRHDMHALTIDNPLPLPYVPLKGKLFIFAF